MVGNQIVKILKIEYCSDFYAVALNVRSKDHQLRSVLVATRNDGETISYNEFDGHLYPRPGVERVETSIIAKGKDDLGVFLETNIERCEFGVGTIFGTQETVLYYFRCIIADAEFLFFNSGDIASCPVNQTDQILSQNGYSVDWSQNSPFIVSEDVSWLVSIKGQ